MHDDGAQPSISGIWLQLLQHCTLAQVSLPPGCVSPSPYERVRLPTHGATCQCQKPRSDHEVFSSFARQRNVARVRILQPTMLPPRRSPQRTHIDRCIPTSPAEVRACAARACQVPAAAEAGGRPLTDWRGDANRTPCPARSSCPASMHATRWGWLAAASPRLLAQRPAQHRQGSPQRCRRPLRTHARTGQEGWRTC